MMQRLRLLVLGIVGFLGVFFAHGSWLNRLLAFTLCGVLSADSGLCMAQIAKFSGQANATTPILLSQRSSEFDDPPDISPSNNPQAPPFPLDAGPDFIRPDFANPNTPLPTPQIEIPNSSQNQQENEDFNGIWFYTMYNTLSDNQPFFTSYIKISQRVNEEEVEYTIELCDVGSECYQIARNQPAYSGTRIPKRESITATYEDISVETVDSTDNQKIWGEIKDITTDESLYFSMEKITTLTSISNSPSRLSSEFSRDILSMNNNRYILQTPIKEVSGIGGGNSSNIPRSNVNPVNPVNPTSTTTTPLSQSVDRFTKLPEVPPNSSGVTFQPSNSQLNGSNHSTPLTAVEDAGQQTASQNMADEDIRLRRNQSNIETNATEELQQQNRRVNRIEPMNPPENTSREGIQGKVSEKLNNLPNSSSSSSPITSQGGRTGLRGSRVLRVLRVLEKLADKWISRLALPMFLLDFNNAIFTYCMENPESCDPEIQRILRPQDRVVLSALLKQGRSYGDPHIATFDGYGYSFQTIGEFILVQSKDGAFQVQTRQGQVPGRQMSLNTGVAMKVGNSKVSIYSKDFPDGNANNPVWVDDRPVAVERTLELPGGGTIQGGDGYYTIQFPTGERVIISRLNVAGISFMNVNPAVPEQADRYIGLLGNLNNNKDDDLQTRDGRVIPSKNNSTYGAVRQLLGNLGPIPLPLSQLETAFFDQLYKEFGDSWRVTQAESLFTYAPNQSTDTFTNRNFPNSYASLASLLPADIRRAEQICQQAGVPGDLLEGCLFDVAATGEGGFVQAALDNVLDQVRDRVQNEIRNLVPVPIPLPF